MLLRCLQAAGSSSLISIGEVMLLIGEEEFGRGREKRGEGAKTKESESIAFYIATDIFFPQ